MVLQSGRRRRGSPRCRDRAGSTPCTAISRAPITILRCFSNTAGQTTRLAIPVSSSMVMKTTPLACPAAGGSAPRRRSTAVCRRGWCELLGGDELLRRIMRAQEMHRMRLQAQADGLVIADHMLGERHHRKLRGLALPALVARLGISEQRQIGRLPRARANPKAPRAGRAPSTGTHRPRRAAGWRGPGTRPRVGSSNAHKGDAVTRRSAASRCRPST